MTAIYDVLTTPPPAFSRDAASAILLDHYGLSGDLEALASERDQNFRVTLDCGTKYVLKFANSVEDSNVTDFQSKALQHIERAAPELPVPRLMPTSKNEAHAAVINANGHRHVVRLLTWIDGVPLKSAVRVTGQPAMLGTCLARLGHALRGYRHPASSYALLWDLKHALALRDLLRYIDDDELRRLCADRLDAFETRVLPKLDALRWQVIHNDLNPSNVLVDSNDTQTISGIIDFGDMVASPLIADIAIACAYLLCTDEDGMSDVLAFVSAYNVVEALQSAELELLFDLMLTRSTTTVAITHWRAARYPENRDYILRSETTARNALERMAGVDNAEATAALHDACRA